MRAPVLARAIGDRRRSMLWWSVGVAAYVVLIVAVYPSVRDASGMEELLDQYPESLRAMMGIGDIDLGSGAGYLAAELFGFMVPLFVVILAVGGGADAVAGAEERGALDLLLSHPVARRAVMLQHGAVVALQSLTLGLVVTFVLLVAEPVVDLELSFVNLVGTVLGVVLLGVLFGWTALALGAALGSKGLALGVSSALVAAAYVAATLPELVDGLEPLRWVSPYWYGTGGTPIASGPTWWYALVLAGAAVTVLAAGIAAFTRRDLAR